MVQAIIPLGYSATQAEIDAGVFNAKAGGIIHVIDGSGQPTGVQYDVGATGNAPTQSVTGGNINAVLASAGGAGWEKAQATAANYVITRPTSGASLDLHIEVGGTLAALAVANWPIPAAGVDQLRIRNMSAIAQSFTVSGYSGIVTADGNQATSGSYSIPVDMAVHITIDEDGWIQVAPMGQEVSQAELNAVVASLADGSVNAYFDRLRWDGATALTGTNLNGLTVSGFYDGQTLTNAPNGATGWFYILHQRHSNLSDATWHHQTAYALGSGTGSVAGEIYARQNISGVWSAWARIDNAAVPALSSTAPAMDGTAAVGTGTTSARADHVHASDTSRATSTHTHTGTYEPANTNIQTHVTAAHAPATAEANVQSDWNATTGDELILNKPTIPVAMVGATASVAGTAGLIPQPLAGEQNRFLRADGNWRAVGTTESIPVAGAPYSNLIKTLTATPSTDNFGGGAFTIRQAITSPILGASTTGTTKARMRVKSGSVAMVIVEAYIGIRGVGDAFASTPTQVFFNGLAGITVPINTEMLSDIASFALVAGNDVMLSFYISSGKFSGATGVGTGGTPGVQPYYLSNANVAATLDPVMGVASAANETYALNLEVYGVAETLVASTFVDNAAATAGGLLAGQIYRTSTGQLMVRF